MGLKSLYVLSCDIVEVENTGSTVELSTEDPSVEGTVIAALVQPVVSLAVEPVLIIVNTGVKDLSLGWNSFQTRSR